MNKAIITLIIQFANLHHIEPRIALAIVKVESGFNVNAVGAANEQGLFQILPSNARGLTSQELAQPLANIAIGMSLLREAKDKCPLTSGYDWINCYNLGTVRAKKIKHPKQFAYYIKVMKAMKEVNRYVSK